MPGKIMKYILEEQMLKRAIITMQDFFTAISLALSTKPQAVARSCNFTTEKLHKF